MIDYCKTVLKKVSFEPVLFEKELIKSLKWLNQTEKDEFIKWCSNNFKNKMDSLNIKVN
jgi:hypothetical protein